MHCTHRRRRAAPTGGGLEPLKGVGADDRVKQVQRDVCARQVGIHLQPWDGRRRAIGPLQSHTPPTRTPRTTQGGPPHLDTVGAGGHRRFEARRAARLHQLACPLVPDAPACRHRRAAWGEMLLGCGRRGEARRGGGTGAARQQQEGSRLPLGRTQRRLQNRRVCACGSPGADCSSASPAPPSCPGWRYRP